MITIDILKSKVSYDPISGKFIALQANSRKKIGEELGSINGAGYVQLMINNRLYLAHILAWFYMTEEWPIKQIEHKNRIRSDNSFANLRESNQS